MSQPEDQQAAQDEQPSPVHLRNQYEFRNGPAERRGSKTYKEVARDSDDDPGRRLSTTTIATTLQKDALPKREFVVKYLRGCGLSEAEQEPWLKCWKELDDASPGQKRILWPQRDGSAGPGPLIRNPMFAESGPTRQAAHPAMDRQAEPERPFAGAGEVVRKDSSSASSSGGRWKLLPGTGRARLGAGVMACAVLFLAIGIGIGGYALSRMRDQQHTASRPPVNQREDFKKRHCGTLNRALITQAGGECTGVTDGSDGSHVFGSAMAPVLTAIGKENARATRQGQYVTIAFLAPLTSAGKTKDLTLDQFVGEVEGAYTAVERANKGDSPLKIRLALANMGSGEQHWRQAVGQLTKSTGPAHPVAVAGMGLSRQESVEAARALSAKDIPMVADLITADGFDTTGSIDGQGGIKGLTRITLTNAAQLGALGDKLADDTRTAALVRTDVTPNNTTDFYTSSLYQDFRTIKGLSKHLSRDADFSFSPLGGADSILDRIGQNLCNIGQPIDTVYFAAREKYLPDFLKALSQRSCHARHITVVAGSDTAALDPKTLTGLQQQGQAPITVLYASLPSSSALRSRTNSDRGLYEQYLQAFSADHHGVKFDAGHATRGYWPVLAHDAVLTITTAIRNATTPDTPHPNKYAVRDHLYALTDGTVPAATGRYGINPVTGNRTTIPTTIHHLGSAP